jgi:hypothetical protein
LVGHRFAGWSGVGARLGRLVRGDHHRGATALRRGLLEEFDVEREEIVTRSPSGALATFARSPALAWVEGLSFGEDAIKRAVMLAPATRMYGPAGEGSFKVLMAPLGVNK